jgi:hypothetical protein
MQRFGPEISSSKAQPGAAQVEAFGLLRQAVLQWQSRVAPAKAIETSVAVVSRAVIERDYNGSSKKKPGFGDKY